ncbi:hypothetical protein [Enterococcus faecalis]|uniref:hypothetical protein n=1 Tax=Enterococcus faecalis TaxID=1351 RepID=UPI00077E08CE|nr:hypothetical protein [Enterococcus faecalis]
MGEFWLISEGVASVPAVYQFLSLGQKSKVIFVPGSFLVLHFKINDTSGIEIISSYWLSRVTTGHSFAFEKPVPLSLTIK